MSNEDIRIEMTNALRSVVGLLRDYHDTVDTDSPLVQAPNWAMHASNWIEMAIEEIEGARL